MKNLFKSSLLLFAVSTLLFGGCGTSVELTAQAMVDEICTCKDITCIAEVRSKMEAGIQELQKPTEDDIKGAAPHFIRMAKCTKKIEADSRAKSPVPAKK
jgi:hypothetical protein